MVHGSHEPPCLWDDQLFFGPEWSPDGRPLVHLDCHPKTDPARFCADTVVANLGEGGVWGEPRWLTTEHRQWFGASFGPADARGGGSNTSGRPTAGRSRTRGLAPGRRRTPTMTRLAPTTTRTSTRWSVRAEAHSSA